MTGGSVRERSKRVATQIGVYRECVGRKHTIAEVRIRSHLPWRSKHWRALAYNYRSTPYFEYFEPDVEPFFQRTWINLGALTSASIELLYDLMDLSTKLVRASTMDGAPGSVQAIREAVGEATLVMLPEQVEEQAMDDAADDAAQLFQFDPPEYHQNFEGFEPGMSTVDLLFNYGPEALSILANHATVEPLHPAG